jgi:exodeoxyribonuclease-5
MVETNTIQLTPGQEAALQQLLAFARRHPGTPATMVLRGYAGTGKTTLVGQLLARVADSMRVAVAAPTNKAVGVLRQKVGDVHAEFRSIHSFLGLRMKEREDGSAECTPEGVPSLHEYDLAVIDECSMIGDQLFGMIATLSRDCRVLYVGDPAQLPPIERSSVVPTISATFTHVQHGVMLSEVVRQAADNPIIALSMAIRRAIESGRPMRADEVSSALPAGAESHAVVAYGGEATAYNWALSALEQGIDARIVAYTNAAVDGYNRALHAALYGNDRLPFAVGERVIVNEATDEARLPRTAEPDLKSCDLRHSQRTQLQTSEEGVVIGICREAHPYYPGVEAAKVLVERDGGGRVFGYVPMDRAAYDAERNRLWTAWRELKTAEGPHSTEEQRAKRKAASAAASAFQRAFLPLRHVYAITAHKSQGSTIDTVIVDYGNLSKIHDGFTFNRSLYVAATRAARYLAVVA